MIMLALAALALALFAWRIHVERRRLRAAAARLEGFHRKADERAARDALRPSTGNVAASSVRVPTTTNGRPHDNY